LNRGGEGYIIRLQSNKCLQEERTIKMLTQDQEFIFDKCEEVLRDELDYIKNCMDATKRFTSCLSADQKKEYIKVEAEQVKAFNIIIEKIYLKGKSENKVLG
jgi:hypothetical protein